MKFINWLPITKRNRVALCLAGLSLVMFVVWNILPYEDEYISPQKGILAFHIWPIVVSPQSYLDVIHSPNLESYLDAAAFFSLALTGLVVILSVPFWKTFHSSSYIRLPIALLSLSGGSVILWHLFVAVGHDAAFPWPTMLVVMALGMFCLSAAFFTFKNELALRSERIIAKTKKP